MTIPDPAAEFFVHPTAVVDEGAAIGPGTKIWHFCHIMPGAELGPGCNLGQNVMIASGVKLGRNVKIQNNVSVYTGVVCEDDVFLGPSCVFTNVRNPRSAVPRRSQYLATVVRRGATVGANATIVCGTEIGEYAFVGAGAVVTKPVPPYALVVGAPARRIRCGHRLEFDAAGTAVCPESGEKYLLNEDGVHCME